MLTCTAARKMEIGASLPNAVAADRASGYVAKEVVAAGEAGAEGAGICASCLADTDMAIRANTAITAVRILIAIDDTPVHPGSEYGYSQSDRAEMVVQGSSLIYSSR